MHEWIMGIGYAIMDFFAGIDGARLLTALTIAGVGMLGIFVVIGIVMLLREVQPYNAPSPMLVTLSGIVMLVRLEQ